MVYGDTTKRTNHEQWNRKNKKCKTRDVLQTTQLDAPIYVGCASRASRAREQPEHTHKFYLMPIRERFIRKKDFQLLEITQRESRHWSMRRRTNERMEKTMRMMSEANARCQSQHRRQWLQVCECESMRECDTIEFRRRIYRRYCCRRKLIQLHAATVLTVARTLLQRKQTDEGRERERVIDNSHSVGRISKTAMEIISSF